MLLVGAGVAVAIGAVAAMLRPEAPLPVPSHNLAIPVPEGLEARDPRVMHEALLEELIQESVAAERVERIPAFSTFVLLYGRDPEGFSWVIDRLHEPDVPTPLVTGFAGHLSTRRRGMAEAVHRLLISLLEGAEGTKQRAALDVLRGSGLTSIRAHTPCRCAFGSYPATPTEGEPMWLVAFPLDAAESVSWDIRALDDASGWHLGLAQATGEAEQAGVLVRRVEAAPPPPIRLVPSDQLGSPLILDAPL